MGKIKLNIGFFCIGTKLITYLYIFFGEGKGEKYLEKSKSGLFVTNPGVKKAGFSLMKNNSSIYICFYERDENKTKLYLVPRFS